MISTPKATAAVAVVAGVLFTSATAQAIVIYDNGPANGTVDAWTINFGYAVADSFTLAGPSTLNGASFTLWNLPGDITSKVVWSIIGSPTAGPTLASGTASVSQIFQFTNGDGFDINLDTIALFDVTLGTGTYWFELQNADVNNGDPTYWDMNGGGASQIWDSAFSYNPDPGIYAPGLNSTSDSFQILGTTIPEPASLLLLASGLVSLNLMRLSKGRSSST